MYLGILFSIIFSLKLQNSFFLGSKHDNLIPFLSRKCRAFALDNNEKTSSSSDHQNMLTEKPGEGEVGCANIERPVGTMVDEDDDENQKPDLSQIIRSLDTPPPS